MFVGTVASAFNTSPYFVSSSLIKIFLNLPRHACRDFANFMYMNLESLMCLVLSVLFVSMAYFRIAAGKTCIMYYQQLEMNATSVCVL